jgi:glutathione S-transferase
MSTPKLTIIIGDKNRSSWSMRPWLALDASGLPYGEELIFLDQPGTKAKLVAASPNGKVPALRYGDLVVPESLAICELVAELAPAAKLWPEDRTARAMARAVATEMHAGFPTLRKEHPLALRERIPKAPSAEVRAELARFDALVASARERFGSGGAFLFGDFTIADCMLAPVASRLRTYDLPAADTTRAWQAAIFAHPSFQKWEKGALAEP